MQALARSLRIQLRIREYTETCTAVARVTTVHKWREGWTRTRLSQSCVKRTYSALLLIESHQTVSKIGQKSGKVHTSLHSSTETSVKQTRRRQSEQDVCPQPEREGHILHSGRNVNRIRQLLSWFYPSRWNSSVSPVMSNDGVPTDTLSPNEVAEEEFMDAQESPNPAEVGDSPRTPHVSPIIGCEQDDLELPVETVTMETMEAEVIDKGEDPFQPEGIIKFELTTVSAFASKHDSQLSPPVYIRDMPWRLLMIPREPGEKPKTLGVFVQCNPQGPDVPLGWTCLARATIRLINHKSSSDTLSKDINHCFNAKENDWGYSNLATFEEMLDPAKGFVANDAIQLEALVIADAPHGINWDSKKHTGYVGLKNQGATCYMNSLLQTLYFTLKLRKAVYLMPTEHDDPVKSVPLAMQRIFFDLQHSDKSVGTKKLTKSFGWDTVDVFMQHDVQELSRVLLDNLENKMKGTVVEGTIPQLFEGKMESYVRCTDVEYRSCREEPFFDIQLNVKGKKNVRDSFKDYIAEETLDGDNKYDAGTFGLQEAKKGVTFTKLPPVLHLHLMRFLYDPITDSNVKINDYFEFPEKLDLEEFLKAPESTPAKYTLHSVLVHSGDNYGGHYVVHLNPEGTGKWMKFDDDVVSRCSKKEAVDYNYGGNEDGGIIRSCSSAYMLVYIRDSHLKELLLHVKTEDIPDHLRERFAEEKRVEAHRRKERNEALLYFTVEAYKDDDFQHHIGPDLYSSDIQPWVFKVLRIMPMDEFRRQLAESLGYPVEGVRIWPFESRSNNTLRPAPLPDDTGTQTVHECAEKSSVWRVFIEMLQPDAQVPRLPPYNHKHDVLLFFKYYNPLRKCLTYVSHSIESVDSRFCDLFPKLCEAVGLPTTTQLDLYEEVKPNMIEQINPRHYLRQLEDIRDGDIVCFQRADLIVEGCELPTVDDFFRDLYNRVDVTFCNRTDASDAGFTLTLNQKMNYAQVARAAGDSLQVEPQFVQFFKPSHLRNAPDVPIRYNAEGCLRDFMLLRNRLDMPPILYYQVLSIKVAEFENKKCFKCVFISANLKEERDLTIYVSKQSLVGDLLQEAAKELTSQLVAKHHLNLRLVEVLSHRIFEVYLTSKPVNELGINRTFRIEEIQPEQAHIADNEVLIPVAHFNKEPHNMFGTPFLIKISDGEKLSSVKIRIQKHLDVPDKDFEQWKFALVHQVSTARHFVEDKDDSLFLQNFSVNKDRGVHFPHMGIPYLGIDHVNKHPKRTRFAYMEKAIKIHN